MKRKVFSPIQLAALAASGIVPAPAAAAAAAAPATEPAKDDAAAVAAAAAAAAAAASAEPAKPEAAAAPGGAPEPVPAQPAPASAAAAPAAAADTAVVTFLQGQIKEKDAAILALSLEKKELEAQASETAVTFPALLAIAAQSVNNMTIALGGSALDLSQASATEVLAHHKRVETDFQNKFKAGGVAAVDAAAEADAPAAATLDPMYHARLNAARPQSKKG